MFLCSILIIYDIAQKKQSKKQMFLIAFYSSVKIDNENLDNFSLKHICYKENSCVS